MSETVEQQLNDLKGSFVASLRRNNKQIRDDRALTIAKTALVLFKREVEDLAIEINNLQIERDNMIDLGGISTTTIISPSDFDAKSFVQKDLDLGLRIRQLEIKHEIADKRYNELFGGAVE